MLHKILDHINQKNFISEIQAHCDIPCKIYDPLEAQIATLTIIRTTDLLIELIDKVKGRVPFHSDCILSPR